MNFSPRLNNALKLVAQIGAEIESEWWIIGSTAALLAGYEAFSPEDVDLFGSTETMHAFVSAFGQEPIASAVHLKFRSNPYQRISFPESTPIEVMGGLKVFDGKSWHPLQISSRIKIHGFGKPLWIPNIEDQIRIFELFGRPKDLAKAAILRAK